MIAPTHQPRSRTPRRCRPEWLLAGILALAAAAGCHVDPSEGYTLDSQYPEDVKTVAVKMFTRGSSVYRRGLELRLTEAVVKHIEFYTPYKVVLSDTADTELTGTITGISQRVMSMVKGVSSPRENEVVLTATMRWQDLRTGEVRRRETLRAAGSYIPLEPFGEDFFQGSEDAINKLAKRIVEEMEEEW